MTTQIGPDGFFTIDGEPTTVHAAKTRSRWQYRYNGPKGDLIAAGMPPKVFVRKYWFREDFEDADR